MKTKKIKISELKVGDRIKSFDPSTGEITFKKVSEVWETTVQPEDQVELIFTDWSVIKCSKNHPIMCRVGDALVEKYPLELSADDMVVTDKGIVHLSDIKVGGNNDTRYIDISVEDTEIFFAQSSETGNMVLTHNCSQGGVRGGAGTVHFPFWHYEFESLVVLKNNKGVEENRVRHMDYCVQFNRLFFKRLLNGESITLFSPHETPGLLDAFYSSNHEKFESLYKKYESSKSVKMKKTVSAFDLAQMFLDERFNTGRIYAQFIDHVNSHGSFDEEKHPITTSNLCSEIALPTRPFESLTDPNGRIALCTLSAINWGNIKKPQDFEKPCELAVRALDALLSYQDYPVIQAKISTDEFRTLGIGIVNLAYFLAKNNVGYSEDALPLVDEYMEAMSYYLIKASNQLAKEFGACNLSHETKYGKGVLPYDTRKEAIDELVKPTLRFDWESLREDLKTYGIRNATLMAVMPAESSSQLSNATNGIEPVRGFVSEKASKDGVLKQVVPEYYRLKNKYDLLWSQPSPEGYIKIAAVLQKWIDQSISVNTSYNPSNYPDGKVPLEDLIKHFVMSYKYAVKNLYYNNTYDGASDKFETGDEQKEIKSDQNNPGTDQEEDCDSCKL